MNGRRVGQGRAAEPASRPRRSLPETMKAYQFKPGQSGNPRGGNHLQTLRSHLAKLDPVALEAMERVLKSPEVDNKTWRFVLRCYIRLRYPEEWKAGMAQVVEEVMPLTINAGAPPSTPEVQELKRVIERGIVDAVATYAKQKEVESGASQPPALPNLRVKPPTAQAEPAAAAVENGRSETLPPASLPFGNWK